jgi:hypothetical protein
MAFGDTIAETAGAPPIKVTDRLRVAEGAFGIGNVDSLRHECELFINN